MVSAWIATERWQEMWKKYFVGAEDKENGL